MCHTWCLCLLLWNRMAYSCAGSSKNRGDWSRLETLVIVSMTKHHTDENKLRWAVQLSYFRQQISRLKWSMISFLIKDVKEKILRTTPDKWLLNHHSSEAAASPTPNKPLQAYLAFPAAFLGCRKSCSKLRMFAFCGREESPIKLKHIDGQFPVWLIQRNSMFLAP